MRSDMGLKIRMWKSLAMRMVRSQWERMQGESRRAEGFRTSAFKVTAKEEPKNGDWEEAARGGWRLERSPGGRGVLGIARGEPSLGPRPSLVFLSHNCAATTFSSELLGERTTGHINRRRKELNGMILW